MQTQHATPHPRKPDPTLAVIGAEEDYTEEVHAFYDVTTGSVDADLREFEALARMTRDYASAVQTIINRLNYGKRAQKYAFIDCVLDQIDDALEHGGGNVVTAHVKKMEAGL